jgi:ElaA protein
MGEGDRPAEWLVHVAAFGDLSSRTAYLLWQLRTDVFVVEQECAYRELDGRDLEPSTLHLWVEQNCEPVGYLRVLAESDDSRRIGRVCVSEQARGGGLAGALMRRALDEIGDRRCALDAQSYLSDWYAQWGFAVTGPEFLDDGIPHVPMARSGTSR